MLKETMYNIQFMVMIFLDTISLGNCSLKPLENIRFGFGTLRYIKKAIEEGGLNCVNH